MEITAIEECLKQLQENDFKCEIISHLPIIIIRPPFAERKLLSVLRQLNEKPMKYEILLRATRPDAELIASAKRKCGLFSNQDNAIAIFKMWCEKLNFNRPISIGSDLSMSTFNEDFEMKLIVHSNAQ